MRLRGFGIHETDTARLRKFVGPPLLDSFSELYAMTPEQAQAAVARYRERYLPVGIYECTLYPGIPELLEQLRAHGFRVAGRDREAHADGAPRSAAVRSRAAL